MTSMQPYYEDGSVTLYHGDCRDVLPTLSADSVITDPPYGTGHYATDTAVLTPALLADFRNLGPCAVFGWPERLIALCVAAGVVPDEWVTWWPTNGAIRGMNFGGLWRESEAIAVLGAGKWDRLRVSRGASSERALAAHYGNPSRDRGSVSDGQPGTRFAGDVWTEPAPGLAFQSHLRLHPNEKPLGIMERLVEALSDPGQTVLDPFAGSGTTLVAAKNLGRKAVGIEVEEKWCQVIARRLAQEVLPLDAA